MLDPYAFLPGVASRIAGLAVGHTGSDPSYVFHTDYLELGRGMRQAHVRFDGLRAKLGSIQVRVHMLTKGEGSRLVLVDGARIALARLIHQNGELVLKFEAFSGCRYALYGSMLGDTDAEAEGLSIRIEGVHEEEDEGGLNSEARNTSYGRKGSRAVSLMASTDLPSLRSPVSQIATSQQITSREARPWFDGLGVPAPHSLDHWSMSYTLQCLQAYGVLSQGARGLGLGPGADAVAEMLRRHGCDITLGASVEADHDQPAAQAVPGLGTDLVNFDFLWAWDREGEIADCRTWIRWVQRALKALLPGGFAVFTFGFDPTLASRRTGQAGPPMRIGRPELEQLALILISRNHEVAQVKAFGAYQPLLDDDDPHHSAQGLIVRRALLPE